MLKVPPAPAERHRRVPMHGLLLGLLRGRALRVELASAEHGQRRVARLVAQRHGLLYVPAGSTTVGVVILERASPDQENR